MAVSASFGGACLVSTSGAQIPWGPLLSWRSFGALNALRQEMRQELWLRFSFATGEPQVVRLGVYYYKWLCFKDDNWVYHGLRNRHMDLSLALGMITLIWIYHSCVMH